ncbi:MAG: hypothetical protein ACE5JI_15895 [Acidobacteriota bacterium]
MSAWGQIVVELLKYAGAALIGVLSKAAYDRWFGKRADLRYTFEPPATFGAGDAEEVFQNVTVTNVGRERADDVRVSFNRSAFKHVRHQVTYDGAHDIKEVDGLSVITVPYLAPHDSLTISFRIPAHMPTGRAEEFFVSAKASNCLGKPYARSQSTFTETIAPAVLVGASVGLGLLILVVVTRTGQAPSEMASRAKTDASITSPQRTALQITLQAPNYADRGTAIPIEAFLNNAASDPFVGDARIWPPWSAPDFRQYIKVNVAGGKTQTARWSLTVPEALTPGRYAIQGIASGYILNEYVSVKTSVTIEVK